MKPQLTIVADATPPGGTDAPSDRQLIDAVARGDLDALGELFDRHQQAVYGFLAASTGITGSHLDDLVQDTFLAALDAAPRYAGRAAVKTWLLGIGLNVARGFLRREKRRRRAHDSVEDLQRDTGGRRPDDQLAGCEQLARLPGAIAALSPKLRQAYVACVVEGMSGEDAARVLGVRKSSVWRRVHEARRQLRVAIGRPS